ncbi:hypothetical protein K402DRAFT_251089 [Aulographum hederae CBS 113979]|uniref:Uncharacterized protein n=1 Tax=Aulographum hederae CBS 113979 TaxID=1176131 RepID=A0A6G1GKA4_9PEZI|nr:hypothetical protein K402DRAFT_251089 [Aulographum hederae CBS 113979]
MEPISQDPIPPSSLPESDMDLLSEGSIPSISSPDLGMESLLLPPTKKRLFESTTTIHLKKKYTALDHKHQTPREAILAARDLIVLASQLSHDRGEQSSLLDLLQIFREYTEKGQVRYASSIIASQVATLENISKRIDNKTKIPKPTQPAQPIQPTLPLQRSVQRQQSKASYAQVASPKNGEGRKAEWTTVQKKPKHQSPTQGIQSLSVTTAPWLCFAVLSEHTCQASPLLLTREDNLGRTLIGKY